MTDSSISSQTISHRVKRYQCLIPIILSLIATPSYADEKSLSLGDCIDLSLRHNLNLASERRDPLIASQNLRRSVAAYQPDLSLDTRYRSNTFVSGSDSSGNRSSNRETTTSNRFGAGLNGILPTGMTYTMGVNRTNSNFLNRVGRFLDVDGFAGVEVRQPLLKNLSIDTTRLQIQLSRLNLHTSESELQKFLMILVTDVEFAYYDLVAARDQLRIFQQSYDLAAQLVESHGKQVKAGRMAPLDEKQAQSRVATSEAALYGARNILTARENDLKLLFTDDFAAWVDTSIIPTTPLDKKTAKRSREQSWNRALNERPEIIQARLQIERQQIEIRFTKNQLYPSLDLTASYGLTGTDRNIRSAETPDYSVGLVISFPIGNGRARADYRAQKLRQQQVLIGYKRLEQNIMAEVDNALNSVLSSAQRVTATGEARAFAEIALEAEETKLANGKSTNFIVLQLQADLTQSRLSETLATVDYNRALAILALREATTLDRRSISLIEGDDAAQPDSKKTR